MTDQNSTETNVETLTVVSDEIPRVRKPRPSGMKYKCSHCGEMGHNVRKCPVLHPEVLIETKVVKAVKAVQTEPSMLLDMRGMPLGTERIVSLILAR